MGRRDDDLLTALSRLPWWISVLIAGIVYVLLRFVLPSAGFENFVLKAFVSVGYQCAWMSAIFLLPAAASAINSYRKRRLLDQQSGIESIRALSWKEFEELVAEAFRRLGYAVRENAFAGPDGGIDITLEREGKVYLVQCKQWRDYKVGVKIVREMLGLMTAHRAAGGMVVTCGRFTREAEAFASANGVVLVEGAQLMEWVRDVQSNPVVSEVENIPLSPKTCPRCGSEMVLRTARRGRTAGRKFWGCSGYPTCKHTENCDSQV